MVLRYTHMINGFTKLAVTKLDILDTFEELKVCTGYKLDGVELSSFPADHGLLERIEPVYTVLEVSKLNFLFPNPQGWKSSTIDCRTYDSLPEQAKTYIRLIEEFLGVKGEKSQLAYI
eukprot:sb/3476465/